MCVYRYACTVPAHLHKLGAHAHIEIDIVMSGRWWLSLLLPVESDKEPHPQAKRVSSHGNFNSQKIDDCHIIGYIMNFWLVVSTPLKNISQLG